MPKPLGKKTKQLRAIKSYVNKGYSANEIQKRLAKRKLGIRRKRLLEEIRIIKDIKIEPSKRQKYVPRKYKKEGLGIKPKPIKPMPIFRTTFIIQDVPVHSRPFRRNYLSFRLQAFSIDSKKLSDERHFKRMLVDLTSEYLGNDVLDWENFTVYIGIERPHIIDSFNIVTINDRWLFRVEKEGRELYSRSGYL